MKKVLFSLLAVFVLINVVAAFHAYKFTHFSNGGPVVNREAPDKLSLREKITTLLLGVSNPRPDDTTRPAQAYRTVRIKGSVATEGWYIPADSAIGTVIVFHGFLGCKAAMTDRSDVFHALHYNVLLVDFMGSGGSEGNTTTVGYKEAEQVKACYEFVADRNERNIILFGTSMGAAAILKAMDDYRLAPQAIIMECPFGTMYETVCARFRNMNVPPVPMASLLVFWGGTLNGFWAFGHNPETYARSVEAPVLLLYGEKDKNVCRKEIDRIYDNLQGPKSLKTYPDAGHENYLTRYRQEWIRDVSAFLGDRNRK